MKPVSVNLMETGNADGSTKKVRKPWRIFLFILLFIIGGLFAAGGATLVTAYALASSIDSSVVQKEDKSSVLKQLSYLITTPDKPLKGEEAGRINILLLGMGGENHDGGSMLTDTIIVASLDTATNKVAMLSIPRDLVVDTGGLQYRKINNAYSFGGIELARDIVSEVTGLEIHYYATIDFDGFRDIVDDLGGINLYVDNSFTDYRYPDYNFGYQTITFEEGWQDFNGERALQYARSRKGNNGEGSDFARSRRQQKVILAIRDKFLSTYTLLNPTVISQVIDSVGDRFSTDIELWEMSRFAQIAQQLDTENIKNQVLDYDSAGVIHSEISSQTGAYVLIPNAGLGNYRDIQRIAAGLFDESAETVANEEAIVEVQNGTTIEGFARQTSAELTAQGVTVMNFSNATQRGQEVTVIYDLTKGQKPETLAFLKEILGANSSTAIPSWLSNSSESFSTNTANTNSLDPTVDFIVVLGYNETSDFGVAEVDPIETQPVQAEPLQTY